MFTKYYWPLPMSWCVYHILPENLESLVLNASLALILVDFYICCGAWIVLPSFTFVLPEPCVQEVILTPMCFEQFNKNQLTIMKINFRALYSVPLWYVHRYNTIFNYYWFVACFVSASCLQFEFPVFRIPFILWGPGWFNMNFRIVFF